LNFNDSSFSTVCVFPSFFFCYYFVKDHIVLSLKGTEKYFHNLCIYVIIGIKLMNGKEYDGTYQ